MTYSHTNLYVVRVVDRRRDGTEHVWVVGPLGSTGSRHKAEELEYVAEELIERGGGLIRSRECTVEPLFEHPDTLEVRR